MSDSSFAELRELPTRPATLDDAAALLQRRFDRERAARKAAEALLTAKSRELYDAMTRSRDSEHRLQLALWASREGIWEWQAADDTMALDRFELAGRELAWPCRPMAQVHADVHVDDRERTVLAWQLHLSGSRADFDLAFRLRHEGEYRWVRMRGRALDHDAQGRPTRVIGTIKDITRQRHAEESLRLMAHAFSSTRDALVVTDAQWRIVEANSAMCAMFGAPSDGLRGRSLSDHVALGDVPLDVLHRVGVWRGERAVATQARRVPVDVSITAVLGHEERSTCYIVALHDISERKQAEARLTHLAMNDTLTGLPNRSALEAHLVARLEQGSAMRAFGLLFMDLDGFKEINDSFGHEAGDRLLREVSQCLRRLLPEPVFIGRWGGDEFVVVLPPGSGEAQARTAGQAIVEMFRTTLHAGPSEVSVSASVGAVLAPRDGEQVGVLLRRVDAAMYSAKDHGRNQLMFYDPSLEDGAQRRVRMLGLLRHDAERDAFRFAAQPKVDRDRHVVSAEILMRWSTEAFGAVSPAEFIPLAEQAGLIQTLGGHAMRAAAQLVSATHALGHALSIAVNLSPKQLQHPDIEASLLAACEREGVAPSMLELELTESALLQGMDLMRPLLGRLREAGFSLALDDFGTGYSSLSYLRQLPFNKVKIDRSFVQDLHTDPRAAGMLDSIVRLCDGLQMTTVAEGVETAEQFASLRAMGVHEFQGYYFSRPVLVPLWLEQLREAGGAAIQLPR